MRISPIGQTIYLKTQNKTTKNSKYHANTNYSFTGNNNSINTLIESQLENIEHEINEYILTPENNKEKFIQIGKIGYDSQEKLKLIKKYENTLFQKKFNALNLNTIKEIIPNALLYEQYLKNTKEFERNADYINTHPIYATEDIINTITKNRNKIYRDDTEFEKLKPSYIKLKEVQNSLQNDLDKISSKNNPLFYQQIQNLDEQNKLAAMLILISGTLEVSDIIKESTQIKKDYQNKTQPRNQILERIEKLNKKIEHYKFENSNTIDYTIDIDQFLEKNKNYKTKNISEKEINETYKDLILQVENTILKYTEELQDFANNNPIKLSPRIIDRTFQSQAKINNGINKLILEKKNNFYASISNNESI